MKLIFLLIILLASSLNAAENWYSITINMANKRQVVFGTITHEKSLESFLADNNYIWVKNIKYYDPKSSVYSDWSKWDPTVKNKMLISKSAIILIQPLAKNPSEITLGGEAFDQFKNKKK